MNRFSPTEWNALANRAQASLNALRTCHRGSDGRCPYCRSTISPASDGNSEDGQSCRYRFRRAQQRLCALARSAPAAQRHQLCRTVATLELTYRQIQSGEDE